MIRAGPRPGSSQETLDLGGIEISVRSVSGGSDAEPLVVEGTARFAADDGRPVLGTG